MKESEKIEEEIKRLYKAKDKAIGEECADRIGRCYHPPGLDVFLFVKAIKGRDVQVIEINNGDIFNAVRNYQDQIFDPTYIEKTAKFKARLKSIVEQIENAMK